MSTLQSTNIVNRLIEAANSTTGKSDQNLTAAVQSLKDGYGTGGSGGGSVGSGEWVRPADYPNYNHINRTGIEAVFFTYDCRYAKNDPDTKEYVSIAVITSFGGWKLDAGYINESGFHVLKTYQFSTSGASSQLELPSDGDDYIVYRATTSRTDEHITRVYFDIPPNAQYGGSKYFQKCVEIYGRLPYLNSFNLGTHYVESFDVIDCTRLTSLQDGWSGSVALQHLNLSGWNTSSVTNLSRAWEDCSLLKKLDISNWNTSKVTNMSYAWHNCKSLQQLNLSGWNASATTFTGTWQDCSSLKKLDVSSLNASKATASSNFTNIWNGCYALQKLNIATIYKSFSLSSCALLDDSSLADVINKLPTVTTAQTLTLATNAKARLTEAQIASATSKGWSIA